MPFDNPELNARLEAEWHEWLKTSPQLGKGFKKRSWRDEYKGPQTKKVSSVEATIHGNAEAKGR